MKLITPAIVFLAYMVGPVVTEFKITASDVEYYKKRNTAPKAKEPLAILISKLKKEEEDKEKSTEGAKVEASDAIFRVEYEVVRISKEKGVLRSRQGEINNLIGDMIARLKSLKDNTVRPLKEDCNKLYSKVLDVLNESPVYTNKLKAIQSELDGVCENPFI